MHKPPVPSLAYLLRLWPVQGRQGVVWRAALEHVRTGEVLGFATLEQLTGFLVAQTTALLEGQTTLVGRTPDKNHTAQSLEENKGGNRCNHGE
jgi:hypothetical protein